MRRRMTVRLNVLKRGMTPRRRSSVPFGRLQIEELEVGRLRVFHEERPPETVSPQPRPDLERVVLTRTIR